MWRLCVGCPRGLEGRATALGGRAVYELPVSGTASELGFRRDSAVLCFKPFHCAITVLSARKCSVHSVFHLDLVQLTVF